jgi:CheY-like chemotaxis protein
MAAPTRIELAGEAYARALAAARHRSTPQTWRRLVRAGQNLREATSAPERRGRRGSVLLVDDEPAALQALREILESNGLRVVTAEHGLAALELLRRRRLRPSAIVLDLDLPVMNGSELRRELLRDPALAHIPVIILSGVASSEAIPHTRRLDKPIEPADLVAALAALHRS